MTNFKQHKYGTTEYLDVPIKIQNVYLPIKYEPKYNTILINVDDKSLYDEYIKSFIVNNEYGKCLNLKMDLDIYNRLCKEKQNLINKGKSRVDIIVTESVFTDKIGKVSKSLRVNNIRINNEVVEEKTLHDF